MERQAIKSSAILTAGYDATQRVLELEMSSHAVYAYHEVPASVWAGLLDTEKRNASVGHYFMSEIRPCFKFTRLQGPEGKSHGDPDTEKAEAIQQVKAQVRKRAEKNRI